MKKLWQKIKTIKITRRMFVIWAVSFVAILVVGFGSVALGLNLSRYSFGKAVNFNNVFYIDYMNQQDVNGKKGNQLTSVLPTQKNAMETILSSLNKSGRTNKLEQLFKTTDEHVTYTSSGDYTQTSKFTASNSQYFIIRFNKPQFSIADTDTRNRYEMVDANDENANSSRLVYEILIPLDRTENKFQKQFWYLVTQDYSKLVGGGTTTSRTISHKFVTYGNYYELGNEIRELRVHS